MLRFHYLPIGLATVFLLLISTVASAQSTTLRVLRTAVVVEEPRGDASIVVTVSSEEVLEVLDVRGSWYLVRPPDGTTTEWRTGWINQAQVEVEVLDAGTARDRVLFPRLLHHLLGNEC